MGLVMGLAVVAPPAQKTLAQEMPAQDKPAQEKPPLGFTASSAQRQRALEARFDASLNVGNLRTWLTRLAARPHHVGSPYGKENAEFLAGLFRSWGYEATIETFDVLFPTPKTRVLELVAPEKVTLSLRESVLKEDATSGQTAEQLPTYNAYSADGDVTAELVYVNYGVPRDYELLAARGVSVKGKIVIARYGGSWRGIKPKVAAEHGAVGCIIYSDPRDDGFFQGEVYPAGEWRREDSAQRGSVLDMPVYPGDPLTPNIGATKDAKRLTRETAPTLMKIPVLPIAYVDALPLLRALGGPLAPDGWRGALPVTYRLGPGPAKVHLKLAFDWNLAPAYNVIARLRGAARPDEWIIRGNHHDAWVNGAEDPISGLVALLEEARGVGELVKTGWRPARTIVYAAWDAEEPGLLGSTEWVEAHAEELTKHAVAYINSDSNSRGFLRASGSHTLEPFINEVARDVADPESKVSVLERVRAEQIADATPAAAREIRERADLRIAALGSGSDYTPFLQHLGIASLDLNFSDRLGGSYHSIFDSIDYYTRFRDPGFVYGLALARVGGRTVLRLANADVLPFQFGALADTIGTYVRDVTRLADDLREQTDEQNRRLAAGVEKLVTSPGEVYVAPAPKDPVPFLSLAPVQNALARLQDRARAYDDAVRALMNGGAEPPASVRQSVDALLIQAERTLTSEQGLPRRPWFRHQIYAPGLYTGYGVKTLPGIREAIEQREWAEVDRQTIATAAAIDRLAAQVARATALASGAGTPPSAARP